MRAELAPERLLAAYAIGIFPMADDEGRIYWFAPDPRAVIELDSFKMSRSLRAVWRKNLFRVTIDQAFDRVVDCCADRAEGTWISDDIKEAYRRLHELGFCHSVEAWQNEQLTGGLYGVTIGGAFFGESMFHTIDDASKVALVYLVEHMRERGYALLDVQFVTGHLRRFGAVEIPRSEYERRLRDAIVRDCTFIDFPQDWMFSGP